MSWSEKVSLQNSRCKFIDVNENKKYELQFGCHAFREMLDGQGKAESLRESWTKSHLGHNGEVVFETVKVIENGKDITEEKKRDTTSQDDKRKKKKFSYSFKSIDSPFDIKYKKEISVEKTTDLRLFLGKRCFAYKFVRKIEDGKVMVGTAWLEEVTGIPTEVTFTTKPLPKNVKSMSTIIIYEFTSNGKLYKEKIITEGNGGFLFIKKNFRIIINFSDYWKWKEPESSNIP